MKGANRSLDNKAQLSAEIIRLSSSTATSFILDLPSTPSSPETPSSPPSFLSLPLTCPVTKHHVLFNPRKQTSTSSIATTSPRNTYPHLRYPPTCVPNIIFLINYEVRNDMLIFYFVSVGRMATSYQLKEQQIFHNTMKHNYLHDM